MIVTCHHHCRVCSLKFTLIIHKDFRLVEGNGPMVPCPGCGTYNWPQSTTVEETAS